MFNPSYFQSADQKAAFQHTLIEFIKVLLFFGLLYGLLVYAFDLHSASKKVIACDLETVKLHNGRLAFTQEGYFFRSGKLQSDLAAHSGTKSICLTGKHPYGLDFEYPDLNGESFVITVWRFADGKSTSKGSIEASVSGGRFWQQGTKIVETDDRGWEKIELQCTPPRKTMNKTLKIYCRNAGQHPIFFDDLKIEAKKNEDL